MSSAPQAVPKPPPGEIVTPEVLRSTGLNATAFSGNLNPSTIWTQMVADSHAAFPYYRELLEKDDVVGSAFEVRRLRVLARDAEVQSADEKNDQAKLFADEAAAFLDTIPNWRALLEELLRTPAMGFVVAEVVWRIELDGSIGVEKIVGRPQELFSFGPPGQPQVGELLFSSFPGGTSQPLPARKFLVLTYGMENGNRKGSPVLRKVFWPSWFDRNALRLDLAYLEKPSGTIAVRYSQGASDEEQKKALAAAVAIFEEVAVAIPQGFEIAQELLATSRTREGKDYGDYIDRLEARIKRRILGQTLTTSGAEAGAGSRALGDVHKETENEIIRSDALLLETGINQLLGWWGHWTFGPQFLERAFRPKWTIEKEPPKDASRQLDIITKAHSLGVPIPLAEVHEKGQIRRPEEGEAVLPPPVDPFGGGASVGPVPPPEESE